MKTIYISILFIFLGTIAYSQGQDSISVISGALLEDLIENNDEQVYDFYSLYDELQSYVDNPLNINEATVNELNDLGIFGERQIIDILKHREKYGAFMSPYELQSISSMDIGTLNAALPFISTGSNIRTKNIRKLIQDAQHTIVTKYKRTLEEKKGYTDRATTPYLGSPDQLYVRYNMQSGRNVRVGLTMEKDAGEEFFAGSNKQGFDYYSGFLHLRDMHPLFKIVNLGDYTISMGQGLILNNNFGGNKSSYVMNIKQGGRVIRPYSSVNEFNYFRGVATTMNVTNGIDLSVFGSSKKVDANVIFEDTLIETGFGSFSSFAVNGLHRTPSEIAKEGAITQQSAGGVLKMEMNNNLKIGVNALYNSFSENLNPSDDLYKKFSFSGDKLSNVSLDYSYRFENFNFFGEVARSGNGGQAHIHGALISLGRNIDAAVVYRNYAKDYHVLNGNAFGEASQPVNERGVYFALMFRPWRTFAVSTYFDTWKNPWLKFNVDAPSGGREFLTKFEFSKRRKYNIYLQYRYEEKGENSSISTAGVTPVVNKKQHRVRLNFTHSYSKELSLVSRVEYNHFEKDDIQSQGFMVFQDLKYKPIGKPYSLATRYALFDTDDSRSRIYSFENDVLYEFSVPFYSGSGSRFYIKGQYRINRNLYVQLRYARTYFNNTEDQIDIAGNPVPYTIGVSNEEIIGNVRSDIKFVVKYTIR